MIAGLLNSLLGMLADDMNLGKGASELQKLGQDQLARSGELVKSIDRLNDSLKRRTADKSPKPAIPGLPRTGTPSPVTGIFGPRTTTLPKSEPSDYMTAFRKSVAARAGETKEPSFFDRITAWKGTTRGKAVGLTGDAGLPSKAALAAEKALATLGKFAAVATVVTLVTKAIVEMTKAAYQFVTQQSESNRQYAMYSGRLAASFAQMDLEQMRRDMSMARNTQGSAVTLNESRSDLEDALQPFRQDLSIIKNLLAAGLAKTGTTAIKALEFYHSWIPLAHRFLRWLDQEAAENNNGKFAPAEDWLNDNRVPLPGKPRDPLPPIPRQ